MLQLVVLIISVLVNSILGLAVVVKNSKDTVNRLFFGLTFSLSIWSTISYFSVNPILFSQIVWVRLVLAAASVLCFFVLTSFAVFPSGNFKHLKIVKPALFYMFGVVLITQTPLVFSELEYNAAGNASPVVKPGIGFFMLLVVSFLGGALYLLFRKFRKSRGQTRNQLRIVLFGVGVSFASIVVTNFVLASFFKNTALISYAPLLTLILTGSMGYAILKHRLFDLRTAVARAMAYLLTFTLIIVIYTSFAFVIGGFLSGATTGLSTVERIFYVSLAVLTGLAFQSVKRFFDKVTNNLFFQDSYDPQTFLDELNRTIVNNVDLDQLLPQAVGIIEKNMKAEYAAFIIRPTAYYDNRIFGNFKNKLKEDAITHISAIARHLHTKVVVTDELADLPGAHDLHRVLKQNNISVIARLVTTLDYDVDGVGFLVLGEKKSGNLYNKQDIRILDIMANELVIAIQNSLRFEEIENFTVTLQNKVDEATKELKRSNKKLKEMDETKDEFISMASHQLRTPLTSVKGYLSMVLEGDAGDLSDMQRKLLGQAFISSQRMVYLIADLLNVSRLRTGKFIIEAVPTDLSEIVQGEVDQLYETAQGRNLTLTYDKPEQLTSIMLDETKIRQVVMNFIDNALYYTPGGGHVTVAVRETPQSIEFTVTDDGLGVPKADQHHLFTKFYRGGNARKARPDGTGLGLFMAKKVVVAQGGAILFSSQEGKGSTFGFTFSKAKLAVPEHLAQKPAEKQ